MNSTADLHILVCVGSRQRRKDGVLREQDLIKEFLAASIQKPHVLGKQTMPRKTSTHEMIFIFPQYSK